MSFVTAQGVLPHSEAFFKLYLSLGLALFLLISESTSLSASFCFRKAAD
jgi:hypothetical protein